jgi:hypothetical protein
MQSCPTRNCACLSAYPLLIIALNDQHVPRDISTHSKPWTYKLKKRTEVHMQSASNNDIWTTLLDRSICAWVMSQLATSSWKSCVVASFRGATFGLVGWACMGPGIARSSPKLTSSQPSFCCPLRHALLLHKHNKDGDKNCLRHN